VKLLPASLSGRVMLILFTGLVVAHAASFTLFEAERAAALNRFAAAEVASRIADYVRSPGNADRDSEVVRPQGPARFHPRIRWREVAAVGEAPEGSVMLFDAFSNEVRGLLTDHFAADPVVWIAARAAPPGEGRFGGPGRTARIVTVALKMQDGRQALAEMMVPQPSLQVPAQAWISIAIIFAVTALFSIWAVRLAVQPVRMLAEAADRLSRNIDAPQLPDRGAVEIRAAARAFNRMQDRLKRHVHGRALAFAAMSHDIRTPLTRMRLRLEGLDHPAQAKLASDVGEIEAIARSALEVTRSLATDEAVARVDVAALTRRLVQDYEPLGARIESSGSCDAVDARPAALRRALGNLIDNALKYGREVSVSLADAREHVNVCVCDRGPGIPEEHLQKVTHPFYRVEASRNRSTGGAGLGLAIAKDLVEGQGGELLLENRSGGGLCATIRLPR
jgi:signal transduction histidine kinase